MNTGQIPNLLSIIRIALAPFIFFAIRAGSLEILAILAVGAIITDYFDGFLARRMGIVTSAGKLLDPIADKLCVFSASLAATIYLEMPVLLFLAVVLRDLAILIVGILIIRKRRVIPISNQVGRIAAFVISAALIVFIFKIQTLYDAAVIFACAAIAISGISYIGVGIRHLSSGRQSLDAKQ